MDVFTAFWHGLVEEDIFMRHKDGVQSREKNDAVCNLSKVLYGLAQDPGR